MGKAIGAKESPESGEYRLDILEVKKFAKIYKKSVDYFIK